LTTKHDSKLDTLVRVRKLTLKMESKLF